MLFDGTWIHVSLSHLVKIGCWEVAENSSRIADKKTCLSRRFAASSLIAPTIS